MITINSEVNKNVKMATNIEYMGEKYTCKYSDYIVPSPLLSVIEQNLFYLSVNSKEIDFNSKYTMKPSYLSYDEYGTVTLEYLLMYINGIQCIEDFDSDHLVTVTVPYYSSIVNICKYRFKNDNINNFTEINW